MAALFIITISTIAFGTAWVVQTLNLDGPLGGLVIGAGFVIGALGLAGLGWLQNRLSR